LGLGGYISIIQSNKEFWIG